MTSSIAPRLVAVVPAAGIGKRMGAAIPKQYLPLCGRTVIEHAIQPLCDHPEIEQVVISISEDDRYWNTLPISAHPKIHLVAGGKERCHSVLNALQYLINITPDALVLVHDAARPCLSPVDLNRLIEVGIQGVNGALLGARVKDTMKRVTDGNMVSSTVDRTNLWCAQTPQMFPVAKLTRAVASAIDEQKLVTDEASAMELLGCYPVMVEGSDRNIKVTQPEDLELAAYYLERMG
ncbi:MAG: 2-C-methyl-D-erythritol 4-phosphate cytidylyltransferase [Pseudomonadales bacterium]|nr:2-C-methyl-D-erythritol 4-phosphate cytidylyltransferase [Pseudomonadales bacterium]